MTQVRMLVGPMMVLAMICGCQNQPRTIDSSSGAPRMVEKPAELVAQSRPPVGDVPMPVGFRLDESESRSYSAGGARFIEHVYTGSSDKFAVARFFRSQMPVAQWQPVTDMFVQGCLLLDFEKEAERCSIMISETGLLRRTQVKVDLRTIGRIDSGKTNQ